MPIFAAKEIIGFAIKIEENGERFYRFASSLTENPELKELFDYLANEEIKHKEIFVSLLSKITKDLNFDNYSPEYLKYLETYIDNVLFTKEDLEKQKKEIKDSLSAIDFAMQKELDSILYYQEIKKFLSSKQNELIEEIIAEEQRHYTKLAGIKIKLH